MTIRGNRPRGLVGVDRTDLLDVDAREIVGNRWMRGAQGPRKRAFLRRRRPARGPHGRRQIRLCSDSLPAAVADLPRKAVWTPPRGECHMQATTRATSHAGKTAA